MTGSNNQVTLTWSPVQDLTSGIDHYAIYRNGSLYATSTTASYTDTSGISSQTRHSYQVAAVNYDGVQGALSLAVSLSAVGIASIGASSRHCGACRLHRARRSRLGPIGRQLPDQRRRNRHRRRVAVGRLHRAPDDLGPGHRAAIR